MKDDQLYLTNIKECIERIESYTLEGKETFMTTSGKLFSINCIMFKIRFTIFRIDFNLFNTF
jgi:uncharacterized protein with HEPN domain